MVAGIAVRDKGCCCYFSLVVGVVYPAVPVRYRNALESHIPRTRVALELDSLDCNVGHVEVAVLPVKHGNAAGFVLDRLKIIGMIVGEPTWTCYRLCVDTTLAEATLASPL